MACRRRSPASKEGYNRAPSYYAHIHGHRGNTSRERAPSMVAWLRVVVPSLCVLYCSGFISASSTCNATSANANRDAGKCAVAKCRGDSSYPSVCKRVSRYTLVLNGSLCCEKLCHLEYPNGSSCLPRTAIPAVTDTGDATAADTRLLLLFIAVVVIVMNSA